jgi:nitroreductase
MDVLDAIRQRRAIRQFKAQPVSQALLRQLVAAGTWAPSAMNGQPWCFVVVTDAGLIAKISEESRHWILREGPALPGDGQLAGMLREPGFHIFHHAPALVVIAAPHDLPWSIEGCTMAAENVMLAATALGLGTCWVGLAQGWLNTAAGRAALHLPGDVRVVAPIAVGHPVGVPAAVTRRQPVVTWLGPAEEPIVEAEVPPPSVPGAGVYGILIHP